MIFYDLEQSYYNMEYKDIDILQDDPVVSADTWQK